MFDFANSSYTTVIITVAFANVFTKVIVGDAPDYKEGNFLWSLALTISYLIVVVTAPLFGAIMDFTAAKKKFLFGSYLTTVIGSFLLFFANPEYKWLAVVLIIISNIGFATGENFVSSFLTGLGPPEAQGRISGAAWALGYFGGLICTALIIFTLIEPGGGYIAKNYDNLRLIGPATGLFFLLSAIPTFLWLKERGKAQTLPRGESLIGIGFKRLEKTMRELPDFRDLMVFLISVFFSWAGLNIVISFAFIYGEQVIKWSGQAQIFMFIITQFTAAGGAFLFGIIQDKLGAKKTFNITLVLWIVSVFLIWGAGDVTGILNNLFGTTWKTETVFLFIGCLAGLGLGSTQSASRAMVGIFSPESKAAEFFGFWGLSGKLAAAVGIFGLGGLQAFFGLKNAILVCAVFFFLALVANMLVNEERGMKAAREHEGE